jgi:hypothetical protein
MELFVASDRPIELSHGWKGEPYLTIHDVQDTVGIQPPLTLPYVRFLGAHGGCSCGFEFGQRDPQTDEEMEQETAGRRSVGALRDFLETQLRAGASVQLLSRWFNEAGPHPDEETNVSPDVFGGDSFELPRSVLWRLRP